VAVEVDRTDYDPFALKLGGMALGRLAPRLSVFQVVDPIYPDFIGVPPAQD